MAAYTHVIGEFTANADRPGPRLDKHVIVLYVGNVYLFPTELSRRGEEEATALHRGIVSRRAGSQTNAHTLTDSDSLENMRWYTLMKLCGQYCALYKEQPLMSGARLDSVR